MSNTETLLRRLQANTDTAILAIGEKDSHEIIQLCDYESKLGKWSFVLPRRLSDEVCEYLRSQHLAVYVKDCTTTISWARRGKIKD